MFLVINFKDQNSGHYFQMYKHTYCTHIRMYSSMIISQIHIFIYKL